MCVLVEMKRLNASDAKKPRGKRAQKKGEAEKDEGEPQVFAQPVNQKLPWIQLDRPPVEYLKDKEGGKKVGQRYYVVKIRNWSERCRKPLGRVTECIGEAGNLEAESLRLLRTFDICTESYEGEGGEPLEHVHECLKVFAKDIDPETQEWIIPEAEIKKRLDLRGKRIFTIDPITAKDLDDALSVEHLGGEIYQVGVHIADVSYFVQQGTDLDTEAQKRCTSTYLVNKVYPMLPRLLCERLCSLNPKVDRLAYSIFFKMDMSTGELADRAEEPFIQRSVIRTCAKWNYELVQRILDREVTREDQLAEAEKPIEGQSFEDMVQDCFLMNEIAQRRRARRFENGSVMFLNREFTFTLDPETRYPLSYSESRRMPSKFLVEEFMLLANILVAEFLTKYCKDKALLRAHNDIEQEKKEKLASFFDRIDLKGIELKDAKSLSLSMERLKSEGRVDDLNVLNRKFLTCLKQAEYVTIGELAPEDYQHYGLNFPIYTHFTSPIRRYADLLVHRLLTISLKEREHTRQLIEAIDYQKYAELCTDKSLNARKASKECQRLFHCLLLKQEGGARVYDCLVFDVEGSNVSIYIEEINIHLKVNLRDDFRVKGFDFDHADLLLTCNLKEPRPLAPGFSTSKAKKRLVALKKGRPVEAEETVEEGEEEPLN